MYFSGIKNCGESDESSLKSDEFEVKKNGDVWIKTLNYSENLGPAVDARLVHEGICSALAFLVNQAANPSQLEIPHYHLREINGKLQLESNHIGYFHLEEFGDIHLFIKLGLGAAITLRFLLQDIDGLFNSGLNSLDSPNKDDHLKFSSLDFGLALYPFLLEKKLLLEKETERLPNHDHRFERQHTSGTDEIFKLDANMLGQLLHPFLEIDNFDQQYLFLTHHNLPTFHKTLKNEKNENKLKFLNDIKSILDAFIHVVNIDNFEGTVLDFITKNNKIIITENTERNEFSQLIFSKFKDQARQLLALRKEIEAELTLFNLEHTLDFILNPVVNQKCRSPRTGYGFLNRLNQYLEEQKKSEEKIPESPLMTKSRTLVSQHKETLFGKTEREETESISQLLPVPVIT